MKKHIILLIFSLAAMTAFGQDPAVFTGPAGVYLKAGKLFPKTFVYRIEIRDPNGQWQRIQQLTYPLNETEFRTRIREAASLLPHLNVPGETEIANAWKKAGRGNTVDSLYLDAANPLYYYALGLGTILQTRSEAKEMVFRIIRADKNTGKTLEEKEIRASTVVKPLKTKLKSLGYRASGKAVSIDFEVIEFDRMQDVKVIRGHLFRNDFTEIRAPKIFSRKDGKYILTILDDGVLNHMAYSYFVLPFDLMGMAGISSDTLSVNNVAEKSITTYFKEFNATSMNEESAIRLSWALNSTKNIISVDVYRSTSYDGEYQLIASVAPAETSYTDINVEPVTGYFYQCQFNGNYQKSFPAPRIPAMLHANQPNLFPPNGIRASVQGNVVQLSWDRQDKDTHGYYLYRGNGFEGDLQLFSPLISSKETTVVYYDTLNMSDTTRTLSYAVADVNTSYAISQPSERAVIQIPAARIPFPTGLSARITDKNILLIWDDVMVTNPNISGYQVFRSMEDSEGRQLEGRSLLNTGNDPYTHNYFNDTLGKPGATCVYEVRSVGLSPDIRSGFCQAVRCAIPVEVLLPPSNVKLFASGNQVVIQWDEYVGQEIAYILITRTDSDKKTLEFRTKQSDETEWTDLDLKSGQTYYYQFVAVDKKGVKSKSTEPLGISVD